MTRPYSPFKPLQWAILLMLVVLFGLASCAPTSSAGIQVGSTAPDFSLPASDGRTVLLADYKGQPVMLYFHMANG